MRFFDKNKKNKNEILVCLAGNPNSGKTTIFNSLTGLKQKVANYPGVTVEKKSGFFYYEDFKINVVDLPGTYSLTAYSIEEIVARECIINEKPDIIINIVDSTNLYKSLYLTTQIKELNIPFIVALNMSDEAEKKGIIIDTKIINKLFR